MNEHVIEGVALPGSRQHGDFTSTHWTQVMLAAQQDGSEQGTKAFETLYLRYWPAIYTFLRRKNHSPSDAEDLTQGFFTHLLESKAISRADRSRGRFRSFLLGVLQRFLVDEQRKSGALKRGPGKVIASLDVESAEAWYLEETDPGLTPDEVYDLRWAGELLEGAYAELEAEFRLAGQADRFDCLKRFLAEGADDGDYIEGAQRLGISVKAMSSAVSRLRDRFRDLVRRQVLLTVASPDEVDPEFQDLFRGNA